MSTTRNGDRGIRSILFALYQSPSPIPLECEPQTFDEDDGSKTILSLKDGKVTIEHQKKPKTSSSRDQQQINQNEQTKPENQQPETDNNQVDNKQTDSNDPNVQVSGDNNQKSEQPPNDTKEENESNPPPKSSNDGNTPTQKNESFDYITYTEGEAPQYDSSVFVTSGKIEGDCSKDLQKQLLKIYNHIQQSIANLYDLPVKKLSLHFGITDKGEIEEKKESKPSQNSNEPQSQNETSEIDQQQQPEAGKLENGMNQISDALLSTDDKPPSNEQNNEQEKNDDKGQLEDVIDNVATGLLDKENLPHAYEIVLLPNSTCQTATQAYNGEVDEELETKFGEFFTEEMAKKIDYTKCYMDLPDCDIPDYKTEISKCMLYKSHLKFRKTPISKLYDLIEPRFRVESTENDDITKEARNPYTMELNDFEGMTNNEKAFDNYEYNNHTKTIKCYHLDKIEMKRLTRSFNNSQKRTNSNKNGSALSTSRSKTSSSSTTKGVKMVFICVRCWHMISSLHFTAFVEHEPVPQLHTLPPRPFQPVVTAELYDKRNYPMGLTATSNTPYSFMSTFVKSPYRLKPPDPLKPPALQSRASSSYSSKRSLNQTSKSQTVPNVVNRLLSPTQALNRPSSAYKISREYKKPNPQPVKLPAFPDPPAAAKRAMMNYSKPPFDINLLNPKRKRKLHRTANGEAEVFSNRLRKDANELDTINRDEDTDRPDFVL